MRSMLRRHSFAAGSDRDWNELSNGNTQHSFRESEAGPEGSLERGLASLGGSDRNSEAENKDDDTLYGSIASSARASSTSTAGSSQKLVDKETQQLKRSKLFVFAVLLIAAVSSSFLVYRITDRNEKQAFEADFLKSANEIILKSNRRVEEIVSEFQTASIHITSMVEGIPGMNWPFVTIHGLEALSQDLRAATNCLNVTMITMVPAEEKQLYEAYHLNNSAWIEEALEYNGKLENTVSFLASSKSPMMYEADSIQEEYRPATTQSGMGYFTPISAVSPVEAMYLFNLNGLGNAAFQRDHKRMISSQSAVFSNVNVGETSYPTIDPRHGPSSYMSIPIWEKLHNKNSRTEKNITFTPNLVGAIGSQIAWHELFAEMIPDEEVEPVVVLVKSSTCNITLAYRVEGPDVFFEAAGDDESSFGIDDASTLTIVEPFSSMNQLSECQYTLYLHPAKGFHDSYHTSGPEINAIVVGVTFMLTAVAFLLYDFLVEKRQTKILKIAARSTMIVSSLFPQNVRDRLMYNDESSHTGHGSMRFKRNTIDQPPPPESDGGGRRGADTEGLDRAGENQHDGDQSRVNHSSLYRETTAPLSDRIMKKKSRPIADVFSSATVLFADVVGFTSWSSARQPVDVFELLETFYACFDKIARRLKVFKVETIGDCYVAVTGLPEKQPDHAVLMTRFAVACANKIEVIIRELAATFGPDTLELKMRFGLHSGPVTAGVLRGDRSRFQLFGDTVNTAARMEQSCIPNKIQISQQTADALTAAGKASWTEKREEKIHAKGKGTLQTYWISKRQSSNCSTRSTGTDDDDEENTPLEHGHLCSGGALHESTENVHDSNIQSRNVEAHPPVDVELEIQRNVDILRTLLQKVVAMREPGPVTFQDAGLGKLREDVATAINEVTDILPFPTDLPSPYNQDPQSIDIGSVVLSQIEDYVRTICSMYREISFHNFSHASRVVQSVMKLMSHIETSNSIMEEQSKENPYKFTLGITSDPLVMFACVLAALVHDVDHQGVPNTQLVKENSRLAHAYNNKSIAENNSLDLAWDVLMDPIYADFRARIYQSQEELDRFRQLMVNMVMATDILDSDLGVARKFRWENTAWHHGDSAKLPSVPTDADSNCMATIVIEHLIQTADVAHTMQQWHVFLEWNERLFHEMYGAYQTGRADLNPYEHWYEWETGFFDFYAIPLAEKLQECGVFGAAADEYLNFAEANRKQWVECGRECVESYLRNSRAK